MEHGSSRLRTDEMETDRSYDRWIWAMNMIAAHVERKKAKREREHGDRKPPTNTVYFDGTGPHCRAIKDGAAGWSALDHIYNHQFESALPHVLGLRWRDALGVFTDNFWIGMMNAQAVRNRYRIIRRELIKEITRVYAAKRLPVASLSVASGSAQANIDAAGHLYKVAGIPTQIVILDKDPTALNNARKLALADGLIGWLDPREENVVKCRRVSEDVQPDIVDIAGLIDYFDEGNSSRLIANACKGLRPGGMLVTCNIRNNPERYFLEQVINWEGMYYREPEDLRRIVVNAGFEDKNIQIIEEPLGIHAIAIARKCA